MYKSLHLGAIDKETLEYESPLYASKSKKYKCPECDRNVIFRKGKIRKPHFAHYKSTNPCNYYKHPNESQIHKAGKLTMKRILINSGCRINSKCEKCHDIESITINRYDKNNVFIEYGFKMFTKQKYADVACVKKGVIKHIFEIYKTHKTKLADRFGSWFEINAADIFDVQADDIVLNCRKQHICAKCQDNIIYFEDGFVDYSTILKTMFFKRNMRDIFWEWCILFGPLSSFMEEDNAIDFDFELYIKKNTIDKTKQICGFNQWASSNCSFDLDIMNYFMEKLSITYIDKVRICKGSFWFTLNNTFCTQFNSAKFHFIVNLAKLVNNIIGEHQVEIEYLNGNSALKLIKWECDNEYGYLHRYVIYNEYYEKIGIYCQFSNTIKFIKPMSKRIN